MMKMIALIAACTVALLGPAAAAEGKPPGEWKIVHASKDVRYLISLKSIERKTMDHSKLIGEAHILVYRDDGKPFDPESFATMVFDCRGHFHQWNHPEEGEDIKSESIAEDLQEIACWAPLPTASK